MDNHETNNVEIIYGNKLWYCEELVVLKRERLSIIKIVNHDATKYYQFYE